MVRPTDQETIATEKALCYSQSPGRAGTHCAVQGHTGKHQGQSGGRGSEGEMWARGVIVIAVGRIE